MNQSQYDILINNKWQKLPTDRMLWILGNELIIDEEHAMIIADHLIGIEQNENDSQWNGSTIGEDKRI